MIELYVEAGKYSEWIQSDFGNNLEEYITEALSHRFNYPYRYRVGKNYTILPNGE